MPTLKPIRRTSDLHIGEAPKLKYRLTQDNTAVDITGYTIKVQLLLTAGDAAPLLTATASIDTPASGQYSVQYPDLTATNTGGRDHARLLRHLVWVFGQNPATDKPRFIVERQAAIR